MTTGDIRAGLATDVGRRRRNNQDLGFAEHGVYVVCDGMGGGKGGERASARTIERLRALTALPTRNRADIETVLGDAQADVLELGDELGGVAGTTVTGLILVHADVDDPADVQGSDGTPTRPADGPIPDDTQDVPGGCGPDTASDENGSPAPASGPGAKAPLPYSTGHLAYVVNIGDSRTYHMDPLPDGTGWDASSLTRITRDHSQRQEAIDSGEMLPDVARSLIPRNVITQCVGDPEGIAPDLFLADATGRFIVCSDGLHAEVSGDAQIAAIAAAYDDPQQAADALVQAALEAGGSDNVTVVVVDMPLGHPLRHGWSVTKLGEEEDIGNIADETLQTLRTITPRRP
ncbi:PP2C family protein-serine/threonine phosphatase [Bifidobacterium platyrrhinorum]|uniref:Serine/threonine-protein phosphatase n=1 Tax=Bifidobacterium platyrrhinorum TaxID=2661628 RepID=A0A6L9SUQ9_9BIFI|nr:serine/threonine-protein phosphatase [Bifidobacterium platyrrhinorum]NEG55839.1 serine/threonine-protein phosphatase [Bifidobacterium platyrrhinorum]